MRRHLPALLAFLLASPLASPAAAAAVGPCGEGVTHAVSPAPDWTQVLEDHVLTFRAPSGREALTLAAYEFPVRLATDRARLDAMLANTEDERRIERQWGSPQLVLSEVSRARQGRVMQLCHAGVDAGQGRRFVSVSVASGRTLQHFYYEAVGMPASAFAERLAAILHPAAGRDADWQRATAGGIVEPLSLLHARVVSASPFRPRR